MMQPVVGNLLRYLDINIVRTAGLSVQPHVFHLYNLQMYQSRHINTLEYFFGSGEESEVHALVRL